MKKILLISSLLACSLITTETLAHPLICPFTDYFTIQGPSQTTIKNLSTDGNLNANISNDMLFTTSCKSNTSTASGHVFVTVGHDSETCYLTVLDGPYESNPNIINVNCAGNLKYAGMDHKWGTYEYTLKFS